MKTTHLIIGAVAAAVIGIGAWHMHIGVIGGESTEPTAEDIARAEELRPADTDLAAIYERSCVACHSLVDSQAPLTGHKAGWAPRVKAHGLDQLVVHAAEGYGNMPAMGYCNDCSRDDLRALIEFMAVTGEQG